MGGKLHYKTAAQLGITEEERTVLFKAMAWLKKAPRGEPCRIEGDGMFRFYFGRTLDRSDGYIPPPDAKGDKSVECHSTGCIWGLCYTIAMAQKLTQAFQVSPYAKNSATPSNHYVSKPLDRLFFPHRSMERMGLGFFEYSRVTPQQAHRWVQHFLVTGGYDEETIKYG